MKEIIEKFNKICKEIASEKKNAGVLRFLGLIERTDLDNKWDLLVSADWVKKSNSEEDLIYIIRKLKSEFGEGLEFLGQIVLLTPNEAFIKRLVKAIIAENGGNPGELDIFKVEDFVIKKIIIVSINFTGLDLEPTENDEVEPVAQKSAADF